VIKRGPPEPGGRGREKPGFPALTGVTLPGMGVGSATTAGFVMGVVDTGETLAGEAAGEGMGLGPVGPGLAGELPPDPVKRPGAARRTGFWGAPE
jgi:hypothetical protein